MSIYDKIEQIRQKPEHIRLRYVWVCVAISMVLVLVIWALSLKNRSYQAQTSGEVAGQASIFDELKKQKESLNQYQQEMGNVKEDIKQELQNAQEQSSGSGQQVAPSQSNVSSKEGFSGSESSSSALPTSNPASLFQ